MNRLEELIIDSIQTVDCPTCKQIKGKNCINLRTNKEGTTHNERVKFYRTGNIASLGELADVIRNFR